MAGHIVSNGLPLRRVRYDASYKDRINFQDLCLLRRWQGIKDLDSIRPELSQSGEKEISVGRQCGNIDDPLPELTNLCSEYEQLLPFHLCYLNLQPSCSDNLLPCSSHDLLCLFTLQFSVRSEAAVAGHIVSNGLPY